MRPSTLQPLALIEAPAEPAPPLEAPTPDPAWPGADAPEQTSDLPGLFDVLRQHLATPATPPRAPTSGASDPWSWFDAAQWDGSAILVAVFYIGVSGLLLYLVVRAFNRLLERVRDGRGPSRAAVLRVAPFIKLTLALLYVVFAVGVAVDTHAIALWVVLLLGAVALGAGGFELMRDLTAGVVLAVQRPFSVGDHIAFEMSTGEVRHIGLISTRLEGSDGVLIEVPNRHFVEHVVTNQTSDDGLFPVTIELAVPPGLAPERARQLAMIAASVSRYSTPYRRAAVTVEAPRDSEHLHLVVRTHAFSPRIEPLLRTDIIELFRRSTDAGARQPKLRIDPIIPHKSTP